MSAGGKTMVRGNVLSANKGAPDNEKTFTERKEAVDAPRSFKKARTNVGIINDKFSSIVETIQPAEST